MRESDEDAYHTFKKPAHSRTNTNTKLNSSSKDESSGSSGSQEEESSMADVHEFDSSQNDSEVVKQKTRSLKVRVGEPEANGLNESPSKQKRSNGLLRAINKRKAMSILELNAATINEEKEDQAEFDETTGLNDEQRKILENNR